MHLSKCNESTNQFINEVDSKVAVTQLTQYLHTHQKVDSSAQQCALSVCPRTSNLIGSVDKCSKNPLVDINLRTYCNKTSLKYP